MDSYYHSHDLGKFADIGKGNKALWEKFKSYYDAVFVEGRVDGAREGAYRPRRRPYRAMPLLHRCLHTSVARKGIEHRRNDRSRPRRLRHSWRGLARSWRADAKCGREVIDVVGLRKIRDRDSLESPG